MKEQLSFWNEIKFKLKTPWKQSAFKGVFIITVLIAFFTILFPLVNEGLTDYDFSVSLAIYFVASIISSSVELSLSFKNINKASFVIYTILSLLITFILFVLIIKIQNSIQIFLAIVGYLFSLFLWIIANSDKSIFNDKEFDKKLQTSISDISNYDEMLDKLKDNDE